MKLRRTTNLILLLAALFLVACGRPEFGTSTAAGDDVLDTDVERDEPASDSVNNGSGAEEDPGAAPPVDASNNDSGEGMQPTPDSESYFDSDADLAFSVYQQVAAGGRNGVFAPHGIARSLVVLHAASDADTAAMIEAALAGYLGADIYQSFNAKDLELEEQGQVSSFQMVGAVWAQNDIEVDGDFVDTLARHLGQRVRLVDFQNPDEARVAINNWYNEQTGGRLTEALAPRSVDETTRFVVTDGTWFAAPWGFGGFDEANTTYEVFRGSEADVQLPMMHTTAELRVTDGPDFDAVVMPYEGDFSLIAVVPDDIESFEAGLQPELLDRLVQEGTVATVDLAFPRIEVSGRVSLARVADSIGLATLFDDAEYPALLDGTRPADAHHRSRLLFDEAGTEATGSPDPGDRDDDGLGAGANAIEVRFDRPFLFAVRHDSTGRLLFMGRVAQP